MSSNNRTVLRSSLEAEATHWPNGRPIDADDYDDANDYRTPDLTDKIIAKVEPHRYGWAVIWEDDNDFDVTVFDDYDAALAELAQYEAVIAEMQEAAR